MATASGLNDFDYQSLTTLSSGLKSLNQIETVNKIPIPPEVMEHFNRKILFTFECRCIFYASILFLDINCHCMMGLFPEIGRAWLTIDSDIYVSEFAFKFSVPTTVNFGLIISDLDL